MQGLQPSRSGRAVLFLLLLILGGFLGLWLWISSGSEARGRPVDELEQSASEAGTPDRGGDPSPTETAERQELVQETGPRGGPTSPAILAAGGRGSIRGQLTVAPGVTFPERWTVVVAPSGRAVGISSADYRRVDYSGETDQFNVPDLPLGGYEVWIEAPEMNSRHSIALLTRTSAHPYLIVSVSPTGFIDGYVIGGDNLPAQNVRVTLEERETKERVETRTRPDGLYRFDGVHDGEYRLTFGPPEKPLVPVRELSFEAPSMRFPNTELAKTVEILIKTRDNLRSALPGVTVTGFGNQGGRIELITDSLGEGRALNLPPGRYRVLGRTDDGRRARSTFTVTDATGQVFYLFLH